MNWRKLWRWGAPEIEEEDHQAELQEARRKREEAERKLRQTRATTPIVNRVSNEALRLRRENQFSARIQEAFGRRHG